MLNNAGSKPDAMTRAANVRIPDAASLADAARVLTDGGLIAFPTETVYGLGADATNARAVASIFATKGRPSFNPLIVHVSDAAQARSLGQFSPSADRLAEAFWPGPLTIVVNRHPQSPIADLVSAGLPTLALRVPAHPIAHALLQAVGRPIAAPSANRSGHVSATHAAHVAADLGDRVAMILDGGATPLGLESTIVDATGDEIVVLRPGAISTAALEAVIGRRIARAKSNPTAPASPGQLESHYATAAPLRLDATHVEPGEALLAFGNNVPQHSGAQFNLSSTGDLIEAAANLFAALRALDTPQIMAIAVMPIPQHGLGEAINDRLRRAAAPRKT